ncbi:protein kinase [Pantoea agglomerans]|uniref:Protein kinase n=1 Tax=Enterobacter agglomerans TaxID=549 RepID=A0A7X2STY6_ENTAG|nr:protein kinase [Pantoea agglomerans]
MFTKTDHIGSGGFGNVSRVVDENGNEFAMKTFSINQPVPLNAVLADNVKKRFIREANLQHGIKHKNIVPVIDKELKENPPYFIMPLAVSSLADDMKLSKNLKGKFLTALMDILSGLEELHSLDIFHRDLKPQNVLKLSDDDGFFYAISDFGLMSVKDTQLSALTHTGMKMGSDYYTAPEIVADLRKASIASDIYSVGCILHDFVGTSDRIPCNEITDDASAYSDIIRACTRKDPTRRFKSVAALRDAILSIDPSTVSVFSAETTTFINLLEDSNPLPKDVWNSIVVYIEDRPESDNVKSLLPRISLDRIKEVIELDKNLAGRLGMQYANWVANSSFLFEQCDGICNRMCEFMSLPNLSCQAEAILALLFMGTSHNRWYVERRFVHFSNKNMSGELAKRVALELSILDRKMCRSIDHLERSIGVSYTDLHPEIIAMVERVCH